MQNRAKKAMELGDLEEVKSERAGAQPASTKSSRTANSSRKQRPPSGKSNRKGTAEPVDGDTFLTDMLFKGDKAPQQRKQNKATFQSATKP